MEMGETEYTGENIPPIIIKRQVTHGKLWKVSVICFAIAAVFLVILAVLAFIMISRNYQDVTTERDFYKREFLATREELRCRSEASAVVNVTNADALRSILEGLFTAFGQDPERFVEIRQSIPDIIIRMNKAVTDQVQSVEGCQQGG